MWTLHQPRSQCYSQLKPHLFNVFSWPLCYLFLWGVELKGSTTTRQALAQCDLRGQEGRYTSSCWGGFLRTSTHWEFSITLWLNARIRKRTIQSRGTSPKRKKKTKQPNKWLTEKVFDLLETFTVQMQHDGVTLELWFPISPSCDAGLHFHI